MTNRSSRVPAETTVDIIIPVLNEAHVLEKSVATVRRFLQDSAFPYQWRVLIVDNGSVDGTLDVAQALTTKWSDVKTITLRKRGRGNALRQAWLQSQADVVCYMDVDLSTDLKHLQPLIDSIVVDGYDIATGSRLMRDSQTTRSFQREIISRIYNLFVKAVLFTKFSDAQCGFKALSRGAVERIVPQVEDQSWFFDTEMLALAEKQGLRIKDLPVRWIEDGDSRVKIVQTGWEDIKGVFRIRRSLWQGKYVPSVAADMKRRQF